MRIAIISGASSGMGRETALALAAEEGADELWLLGRREERLCALADELSPRVACRVFALDLTEESALTRLREALAEAGGTVTWLVAAAGMGRMGAFAAITAEEHRETVMLNCAGLTGLIDLALPYMAARSHILTFSSAAAFLPQPRFAVYAATKAYVLHLSRALARELRPRGISVTTVCPGPVDTEFLKAAARHAPMPAGKRKYIGEPTAIVRAALRGARRGRCVVTPTLAMKAARLAAKLLPHAWLIRFFG